MTESLWKLWKILMATALMLVIFALIFLIAGNAFHKANQSRYISEHEQEQRWLSWKAKYHASNKNAIKEGVHLASGLYWDKNLGVVLSSCTACHSAKLIAQNRATREGWDDMLTWMQQTQGLPELGVKRSIILDYLAEYYAPQEQGRRAPLVIAKEDWWEY